MHPMGVKPLKKISRRWGMQGRRCLGTPCWYFGALPPSPSRRRRPTAAPLGWSASAAAAFPCISRSTVLRMGQADLSFVESFSAAAPPPLAPVPLPAAPPRGGVSGARSSPGLPRLHGMEWHGAGRASAARASTPRGCPIAWPRATAIVGHRLSPNAGTVGMELPAVTVASGPQPPGLGLRSYLRIHLFSRSGGFLWTFLVRLNSHLRSAVFSGSGRTAPFKRRPLLPIQVEKKSRNCTGNRHRWVGSIC
jgi:hypothetical protein